MKVESVDSCQKHQCRGAVKPVKTSKPLKNSKKPKMSGDKQPKY